MDPPGIHGTRADGARVVDYMAFAEALKKRDEDLARRTLAAASVSKPTAIPPRGRPRSDEHRPPTSPVLGRHGTPPAPGSGIRPPRELEELFGQRPRDQLRSLGETAPGGDDPNRSGRRGHSLPAWAGGGGGGGGSSSTPPMLKPLPGSWGGSPGWAGDGGYASPPLAPSSHWGGSSASLMGTSGEMWGGGGEGGGGEAATAALTRAVAAADEAGTGTMRPSQLLLLCRAHGVSASLEALRGLMAQSTAEGHAELRLEPRGEQTTPPSATHAFGPHVGTEGWSTTSPSCRVSSRSAPSHEHALAHGCTLT